MIHLVKVADVLAANVGVRAPATIDTNDKTAMTYWAYRLNVSPQDLAAAIEKVGPAVTAVRQHLKT
ncbi:conserved hypothetical protein [Afipia carboxidovorans OM5]|uniref:DUF3606 domain-containing protein n=1 Tax=Afipia carboxidovorans (strain ATCC 49405 / DSM 1227 / KCTC 32145 / OM5) TaxID=504832 RepID=B6JF34_AFIC5|nr:DUF3606 domain-containing protein [Afipia carboxidovorans]ACI92848.1 conserved hypothetical protein [Afipia carboxidovorans OM5]AEI03411.1 hypothetical protein OCA4_c22870 [Afipia carboxidovorans OM4]AEI06988.1 hypothetical protein OCA5_c22880 [Afipia carboxidovorans OM5]